MVEHNLDVMGQRPADWVIDLGPEAGHPAAGRSSRQGTPEEVAPASFSKAARRRTRPLRILKEVLERRAAGRAGEVRPEEAAAPAFEGGRRSRHRRRRQQDQKLPWEEDGPKWHTHDRITAPRPAKPIKWDGDAALAELVIDEVHDLGTFSETNWNHRSIVEIATLALKKSDRLVPCTSITETRHAYVKFVFRVPGRPFKEDALASQLALKPLSDTPGLEGFSRDSNRVEGWRRALRRPADR